MKRLYLYRWLIGALFLVISIFLLQPSEKKTINPVSKITRDSDYFMENIVIRKYDLSGKLINRLSAKKMEHVIEQDTSTLEQPTITFGTSQSGIWQLTSKNGELKEGNSLIRMKNEVIIVETREDGKPFTQIKTHDLNIDLDNKIATTDNPVSIQSRFYENNSDGLRIDFANEKIYLKSNVRTTIYQKQKQNPIQE